MELFPASIWSLVETGETIVEVKHQEQDEGSLLSVLIKCRIEGDSGQLAVKRQLAVPGSG